MTKDIRTIENTLKTFRKEFKKEKEGFKKFIIVFEYVEYLNNTPVIFNILKNVRKESEENLKLALSENSPKSLYKKVRLRSASIGVIRGNAWVFFGVLDIVHISLNNYKSFSEQKEKEKEKAIGEKLDKTIGEFFSKFGIGISMYFLNKMIIDILTKNQFKQGLKNSIQNTKKRKQTIGYEYDKNNQIGYLKFNNDKILFEKDRALIVYYFYELRNIDKEYKTYRDFNARMDKDISSPIFRQSIDKINERVNKEHKFIKGIIIQKDKNKISEANRYRWKTIT